MSVKLKLLKKGNRRFTSYHLVDYEFIEIQEMINYAVENKSPLHLQYQKSGIEKEFSFNPEDFQRIEILQLAEVEE